MGDADPSLGFLGLITAKVRLLGEAATRLRGAGALGLVLQGLLFRTLPS